MGACILANRFFITGLVCQAALSSKMVVVSCLAGSVLLGIVAVLTFAEVINATIALIAALAVGFVTASVQPPLTAIVQMIVPPERLVSGIVLRTMGQNLAQFVGAVAGGVAIATLDYGGAFAVQSALYLVATLFLLGMTLPARSPAPAVRPPMRTAAREGAAFVFSRPALRALVVSSIMTGLFQLGPIFVLVPEIARTLLEVDAAMNSLLLAFTSIGMLIMSAFMATRRNLNRKGYWFLVNLLVAGPAIVVMGLSGWYPLTAVAMFVWGLNGGAHINLNQALIQINTPGPMMGRVMSIYMLSIAGLIPLGSLLSGVTAEVIGADGALILAGVIFGAYSAWAFIRERELLALD